MKKVFTTSLGKAAAFSAIALAVTAAVAQDAERIRPLSADVKINKQLQITGQPPAGYNPQFTFNVNVTENELPKPPEGCRWEKPTYQPPGGNTAVTTGGAAQVTVINHLICRPRSKCDDAKALKIDLKGPSAWTPINGPQMSVATPYPGWVPNSGVVSWVGQTPNGAGLNGGAGRKWSGDINFCLCSGNATATIDNYRADNSAWLKFDNSGLINAGQDSFKSATGASGSISVSSVLGTHLLSNQVTNDGGPSGWTMNGFLTIDKGYLGACEAPK